MNLNINSDMNGEQDATSTDATEVSPDIYGLGGSSLRGTRPVTGDEQFPDCAMHHSAYLELNCAIEYSKHNRRYFSVPDNEAGRQWLAGQGFQGEQLSLGVGLAIPIHDSNGHLVEYLVQFDAPRRDVGGKAILYEKAPGKAPRIDVTPSNFQCLDSFDVPIGWTMLPEYADSLPGVGVVGINLNNLRIPGIGYGNPEAEKVSPLSAQGQWRYESLLGAELDRINFGLGGIARLSLLFLETNWSELRQSDAGPTRSTLLVDLAESIEDRGGIVLLLNPPLEREVGDKLCLARLLQGTTPLERYFVGKPFSITSEQRRLEAIRHLLR